MSQFKNIRENINSRILTFLISCSFKEFFGRLELTFKYLVNGYYNLVKLDVNFALFTLSCKCYGKTNKQT